MRPRVLVVDDDPRVRSAVCRFLRGQGCVVEAAADGAEGLERVARTDFDAIVTDIQMPRMDGAEFWRQSVALRPLLRDRFLFCSGLPVPGSIACDPAIRVVPKPFAPEDLWTALADLLGTPVRSASGGTD